MLFLSATLKALLQRARTILLNGLDFQAKQKVLRNRFGVLFFYASWKLPKNGVLLIETPELTKAKGLQIEIKKQLLKLSGSLGLMSAMNRGLNLIKKVI